MNAYRTFLLGLLATLAIACAAQAATLSAASTGLISTSTGCDQIQAYPIVDGVTDTSIQIPLLEARDAALTGFATGPDGQQFAYLTNATRKSITAWWITAGSQPVTAALVVGSKGENTYFYNDATQLGVTTDSGLVANGKLAQVAFCYAADPAATTMAQASPSLLSAASTTSPTLDLAGSTLYATSGLCTCRTSLTGTRVCFPTGCAR